MTELKPLYQDHQVEVPRRVWNQIDAKLNQQKQKRKFVRLRTISAIAACFVVAAVLSYVKLGFTQYNESSFVTTESYKSMIFENLDQVNDDFMYDYSQLKEINSLVLNDNPSFGKRNR